MSGHGDNIQAIQEVIDYSDWVDIANAGEAALRRLVERLEELEAENARLRQALADNHTRPAGAGEGAET